MTLYIDTHDVKIILILFKNDEILAIKEIASKFDHSVTTMPLLVELLDKANVDIHDLTEIIVVNGPGSFTGVRIGVTIAKTLAYALQIPIKTMSSLLIKAVSFSHEEITIVEREKNGVFLGTYNPENELIGEYEYRNNKEYIEDVNTSKEEVEIDYNKVITFAKNITPTPVHAVNPLYVKKIEVQK